MASNRRGDVDTGSGKGNMEEKPIRVDKWDGSAVKNALDDAVKKVFTEKLKYIESHHLMDGRLGISGVAVGAAMFALLWDYLHPFPESRPVLIVCVISYFILMGMLTVYTTFIEKGIFLVAMDRDKSGIDPDNEWKTSSSLRRWLCYHLSSAMKPAAEDDWWQSHTKVLIRFDHMYHLVVSYTDGITKKTREASLEKSVSNWFDENGTLLYDLFEPEILKLHSTLLSEKKEK